MKKIHKIEKNEDCYYCSVCHVASGDGDGLAGKECLVNPNPKNSTTESGCNCVDNSQYPNAIPTPDMLKYCPIHSAEEFDLIHCAKCNQMTNHLKFICQKCKPFEKLHSIHCELSTPPDDWEYLRKEFVKKFNENDFYYFDELNDSKISDWWLSKIKEAVAKREGEIVENIRKVLQLDNKKYSSIKHFLNGEKVRSGYNQALSDAIEIITKKK